MARLNFGKTASEIDLLGPAIICLVVNLCVLLLIIILRNNIPPVVPLLYGEPKGEEQLVMRNFLMIPSIFATGVTIVNTLLSKLIKDHFLQRVLFGLTMVTTLLSTVTVIRIVLLIGSF